ncbi:MAG: hypothetical protein MK137_08945 [Rickettsiales bacterium]|nr:hypothetical protein [Rickettsiales bacterium]
MTDNEGLQSDTSSNDADKEIQKTEKRIKDIERFKEGIVDVLGVAMEFAWQPDSSANEVDKIAAYPVKEAIVAISDFSIGILQNHLEEQKDALEGKELSDTEKEVRNKQNSLKILDGFTRFCCYFLFHPLDSRSKVQE